METIPFSTNEVPTTPTQMKFKWTSEKINAREKAWIIDGGVYYYSFDVWKDSGFSPIKYLRYLLK